MARRPYDTVQATNAPTTTSGSTLDWPLPGLRAAIEEVQPVYLPPTVGYLRGLLAG